MGSGTGTVLVPGGINFNDVVFWRERYLIVDLVVAKKGKHIVLPLRVKERIQVISRESGA